MPDREHNDHDLDTLLHVLDNPIRRQILAKIATEKHYPLQLSRELNVSQQAIMKHIKVLEKHRMVVCEELPSDIGGPPRKCYTPTRNFSIRIDCGPHTFCTELHHLDQNGANGDNGHKRDPRPTQNRGHDDAKDTPPTSLEARLRAIDDGAVDERGPEALAVYIDLLREIEAKVEQIEHQRNNLVCLRERIRMDTNHLVKTLCDDYQQRKILHFLLDNHHCTREQISDSLDIRIKVVNEIFEELALLELLMHTVEGCTPE